MSEDSSEAGQTRFASCAAPFGECEVELALYGHDLDPEVVTGRIGLQPTFARKRGDRRSEKSEPAPCGSWLFGVEGTPPRLARDLIHEVLDRLPSDPSFWASLRSEYQVDLRVTFRVATWSGCFELDPATLARVHGTGATLAFHLYGY